MATCYQDYTWLSDATGQFMITNGAYPSLLPWAQNLLLEWSRQDPVSAKETTRNEKVYTLQLNRNPFIDFPDLAEYIWGNKVGSAWNLITSSQPQTDKEFEIKFNNNQDSFTVISEKSIPIASNIFTTNGKIIYKSKSFTNTKIRIPKLRSGIYFFEISTKNIIILKHKFKITHD